MSASVDPAHGPSAYAGVRTLVLGATGFIGAFIAREAIAQGAQVHVAARRPEGLQKALGAAVRAVQVHTLEASDRTAVKAILQKVQPAVLFNGVGYGVARDERESSLAHTLNTELPGWLAEFMPLEPDHRRSPDWVGQRVVHLGSALEYGTADGCLDEGGPHTPTTLYGQTKLAGTAALGSNAAARGLRVTTARLFTVYGPGEHAGRLLPSLLSARGQEAPIPLTAGLQQRDFTYVKDVAEGVLRLGAASGSLPSAINLATGTLHTVRHFVEQAAQVLGLSSQRIRFGALPTRPEEMHHDPVTVARLQQAVGWKPMTSIAEGVHCTARFVDRYSVVNN